MDDYKIPLQTPCVFYDDQFLSPDEADAYYQDLLHNTAWEKTAKINRWVALHEDDSSRSNYKYRDAPSASSSSNTNQAQQQQQERRPFTETLLAIKHKAEAWYNEKKKKKKNEDDNEEDVCFNVCLLNFYEDGSQRIGWHSDREEIGRTTPIASVSLGATRDFVLRSKKDGGYSDKHTIPLTAGSLLVMENVCQLKYLHSIPKQTHVTEGRINLTFRCKTAETAGEEEHERRDKWLERITDIAAAGDHNTTEGVVVDQQGEEGGGGYVFGDAVVATSKDEEETLLKNVVYTIKTNIGTEQYVVAEIMESLGDKNDAEDNFQSLPWCAVPRPWGAAGYVALCRRRQMDDDDNKDSSGLDDVLSILLELRSALYVMEYHDSFHLCNVNNDVSEISGEELYQFYKQRLVDGTADITTLKQQRQQQETDGDDKIGFRVTCERIGGPHKFRAPQVEFEIGGAMSEFYESSCQPKMQDYDVEIRVDVIGHVVMVGTQRNVQDLSRRHYTGFRNGVTIKCHLAYILLRCANVRPGMVVLDPFCGGGTILLEALEMTGKRSKCIGMDVSRRSVRGAQENAAAESCGPDVCEFHCTDARALRKHLEDDSVDAIVSNLPWGIMTGNKVNDLQTLYEIFLRTAWYVLKDKGRIVMLVLRGLQLTRIIRKLGGRYRLLRCNVVRTTNNLPCIVVIEKLATDTLNNSIKSQLAYMSQYVNVSRELYHAIHMEDIGDEKDSNTKHSQEELP